MWYTSQVTYLLPNTIMSEINTKDFNQSTPKVSPDELIQKTAYDKRVDRMDLPEVRALEREFSQEKQWVISQTKEKLLAHIEQSLADGFTVETQEDYEVLTKLLSLLWKKQILPEYKILQHIADRTGKSFFSISYDKQGNLLKLYAKLPQEITRNKRVEALSFMGDISLEDGRFTQENLITQYQFDLLHNNNRFDMSEK